MAGRHCTVCKREDRSLIDKALTIGTPVAKVAQKFALHPDCVYRHRSHIRAAVYGALVRREIKSGESITNRMESLYYRANGILDRSESDNDGHLSVKAIREMRECLGGITALLKMGDPSDNRADKEAPIRIEIVDVAARPLTEEPKVVDVDASTEGEETPKSNGGISNEG